MPRPSITCLVLLFAGPALHAAAPQATFALVKGDLEIKVEQDGVGVKDAKVRILDLGGTTLLDGELGDDGTGSVPLDKRSAYLVGITIPGKKKESDFITLRRHGDTLTPPRVSLGFSKPCCRAATSPRAAPPPPVEVETPRTDRRSLAWITLGVSGAGLVAAAMMLMLLRRP